jgi:hypothetical protein
MTPRTAWPPPDPQMKRAPAEARDTSTTTRTDNNADPAPAQRFAVVCTKTAGARIEFNAYDTRSVADSVAARLRSVGCVATVEVSP